MSKKKQNNYDELKLYTGWVLLGLFTFTFAGAIITSSTRIFFGSIVLAAFLAYMIRMGYTNGR